MTKIYLLVVNYATFRNNELLRDSGEEPLYAFTDKEKAKEEKERLKKEDYKERLEWFKKHEYGLFKKYIEIKEISLHE